MKKPAQTAETPEQSIESALGFIRADYYSEVRAMADDLVSRVKSRDIEDRDAFLDAMHQDIDGHERIIYTFKARLVCLVSENESAYVDNYGADGLVKNGAIQWEVIAYAAMEADVFRALDALDFDVNDDDDDDWFAAEDA